MLSVVARALYKNIVYQHKKKDTTILNVRPHDREAIAPTRNGGDDRMFDHDSVVVDARRRLKRPGVSEEFAHFIDTRNKNDFIEKHDHAYTWL